MSDMSQGPGTTTVLPPQPPPAPPITGVGAPLPPPPGGGAPWWVVVAVALAVALAAGTGVFLWQRASVAAANARIAALELAKADLDGKILGLESQIASAAAASAVVVPTDTAAATTTPAKAKPPKVVTTKQLALVKKVTWSSKYGYRVVADYVQMLTGKAAADAATAAGKESPPPNDFFMVNSSTKLRTLSLPKATPVYVLGWGGAGATTATKIPVGQFMDVMPGGTNPQLMWTQGYYWLTLKNGTTITRIDQQYLP